MRKRVIALCLAAAVSRAWAAGGVEGLDLKADGDVLRIQLETLIGTVGNVTQTHQGGEGLRIELRDVSRADLDGVLSRLAQRPALVRDIAVLPGLDGRSILEVKLAQRMQVLDETVVATAGGRSRWEMVLGARNGDVTPRVTAAVKPGLGSIVFGARDDRIDINLNGTAGLVANASFAEHQPALVLELPGVARSQLQQAVEGIDALPPLVRRVRIEQPDRLVFELAGPADMIDVGGSVQGDAGNVRVSLVADQAPAGEMKKGKLISLKTVPGDGGVDLAMAGATEARVNAYTLDYPPRVVVDFLGWKPEQIRTAAERFASSDPVVGRVAVTETRLGSGRLVFELVTAAALGGRSSIAGNTGRAGTYLLGLKAPNSGSLAMSHGDLPFIKDLQDLRRPGVVIRPSRLAGPYAKAKIEPQPGTRFKLLDLYDRALGEDAKYRAAKADFAIQGEARPQALAAYLPQASFDYQYSSLKQAVLVSPNAAFPPNTTRYPNENWNLTITQPILRPQAIVRLGQAKVTVEQAEVSLLAAEQDLILRSAGAYLGVLAASDNLELAKAEREATGKQLELASARLQSGLGTQTQLHETEARHAMTQAREVEARNKMEDARAALKEIVGVEVSGVRGFRRDFLAAAPRPNRAESWVQAALEQNLQLQVRNLGVEIATREVRRQQAGHLPTVDAYATASRLDAGGSLYGGSQLTRNDEAGVKVHVPIFEGGMTSSLVREAEARRDKAYEEREQELRKTERLTRAAFLGVQQNVASLDALRKTVLAQESALESKLEGYKAGLQSVVAVVDAYRLYFAARRDYLQARYDYLLNRLKLKQAVGSLARNDLEDLAALLD